MDRDRRGVSERIAPDPLEEAVASEHAPWVQHEEGEQLELPTCERDVPAADAHLPRREVDLEAAGPELLVGGRPHRAERSAASAQDRLDPGGPLPRRNGFGT
jgi:hypothetical protein